MSRNTHDRLNDHFGTDLDTNVILDGAVGPIGSGTDLHTALVTIQADTTGTITEVAMSGSGPFSEPQLYFIAGTNVTLSVSDNSGAGRVEVTINASGGGGGGGGWSTVSTTGVQLETGRYDIFDRNQDARITLDGGIYLASGSGWDMTLTTDSGPIEFHGPGGVTLPAHASDPGSPANGETYWSTGGSIRVYDNVLTDWANLENCYASGAATIASGTTVITVTPGINHDPGTARAIILTPLNNPTNDPGWFWVDNVGYDTFDIHVRSDPGASGAIFAWRVVRQ